MIPIGILAALPVFHAIIGISRLPLASDFWQPCLQAGGQVRRFCGVHYVLYASRMPKCATREAGCRGSNDAATAPGITGILGGGASEAISGTPLAHPTSVAIPRGAIIRGPP